MERELLGLLRRVVVLGRRVLGHEQGVVDSAGREEPSAPVAHEADVLPLVVPGAGEADAGVPGERSSSELAPADVECAIDEDVEGEACAGAELERPNAALGPVAELDEAHAGNLAEPADPAQEIHSGGCLSVEVGHRRGTYRTPAFDSPTEREAGPAAP